MYFVNQRGCHFLSGSVLFGDPMFGRAANQSVHIPNIRNGYWCVKAPFVNEANKDGKSKIVLRFSEYGATERYDLIGEYFTYSVSGYLGVFDEARFQAGWTDRCQQWFEYCQHSLGNRATWSVITGGVVFRLVGQVEEGLCRVFSDKLGCVAKLEIYF